jgi:hypothetical protein
VIWAATAVTATINAARVMVDAFNASLSGNLDDPPRPSVAPDSLYIAPDSLYNRSPCVSGVRRPPTAGV